MNEYIEPDGHCYGEGIQSARAEFDYCPYCHKWLKLRKDGTIKRHYA